MKINRYIIILIIITVVAALLRIIGLGNNPPELTWDEAAWGYNAYTIGIDGKDEFGKFLPVTYLESFGDYKPPVYAYLDVLPVKVLGLDRFSTRLPSALAGIGSVFFTYFLVLRLFPNSKKKYLYAIFSSFVLAISPWNIMLSRAAFEANVATFFIISGMWALLAGLQERKWLLLLAAVLLVVPFYTFNSPRVFLPIFIIVLALFLWKKFFTRKKQMILAILLGIILLAPVVPFLLSPQAKIRFDEVNIFSDPSLVQTSNQEIANDHNAWWSKIIHNRRVFYTQAFIQHYLDEFNPSYLFFKGDYNPKFSIQTTGELFIWCIPFLILGLILLFRQKKDYWWIIPIWILIGLIPASTARETPHALRTEVILPTYQIIIAYGLVEFILFIRDKKFAKYISGKTILFLLGLLMLFEMTKFIHSYITHYPYEYSQEWQYGYEQTVAYVSSVQSSYNQIDMTNSLGRPYIYYLFYMQTPPSLYRKEAVIHRDAFGFVTIESFGKYYFGSNLQSMPNKNKKVLYIDVPDKVPTNAKVQKKFDNLDGSVALVAYTD